MNNTPQGQDEEKIQGEDIMIGEVKETIKNELTINPMLYSRGPLMNSANADTMCISRGPLVTNNPHPQIEGENVSPLPIPLALEKCRTNSFSNLNMQAVKVEETINQAQNRKSQSNTLWSALKIIAGGEFFSLQVLQWVNTFIILNHDSSYIGWILLAFGLFPIVVGIIGAVNEAQHYDYYLHLFPRKRAGVIYSIFSLFNLESCYSLSCYSNRDDLLIFNKNYKLKKRINLILNSFVASLLTSVYLFQNTESDPYLITKSHTFEDFFIAFIFISVTDIAFHLAFFSTDFFEDTIALLFQLFGMCCFCNSNDEEEDDDEDYEEASLAKFDQTPLSDHTIAFRQISLSAKTFLQFVANNILLSLSFYFSFMDLSLRIFLFGITLESSLFPAPPIYLIEGIAIGLILIAVIFIGVINCFCNVSNSYFEKSMVIVVSCFQCAAVKLSRWSIHRIFEGMTQRQLFILKFVPGLFRLIEILYIHYILWRESDFSIDSYFFTDKALKIYINYFSIIYCAILGLELLFELCAVLFVYKSEEIEQQNEEAQGNSPFQQQDQQYSGDQRRIPMSLPSLFHKSKANSLNKNNPQLKKRDAQKLSQSFQTPSHKTRKLTKQTPQAHLSIISLQDQPFEKYPLSNQSPVKTLRDMIIQENNEKDKEQTIADERNLPKSYYTSPLINQNLKLAIVRNESEPQAKVNEENIQIGNINHNNSLNYHYNEDRRTNEGEINNQTQMPEFYREKLQKQVTINISESREAEGTFQKNELRSQQEIFGVSEGNGNIFPNKSPDMSLSSTQLHAVQPEDMLNQINLKHYGSQEEDIANISPSLHQSRFAPFKQPIVTAVDPAHAIKTKETLSPVKSNKSIEGHNYQGGTIKLSGAPARKVSDLINRFSSITNQRRKQSQQQIDQNGEGDSPSSSPKKSFSNKKEPHKQGTSIARLKEQLRENSIQDV